MKYIVYTRFVRVLRFRFAALRGFRIVRDPKLGPQLNFRVGRLSFYAGRAW